MVDKPYCVFVGCQRYKYATVTEVALTNTFTCGRSPINLLQIDSYWVVTPELFKKPIYSRESGGTVSTRSGITYEQETIADYQLHLKPPFESGLHYVKGKGRWVASSDELIIQWNRWPTLLWTYNYTKVLIFFAFGVKILQWSSRSIWNDAWIKIGNVLDQQGVTLVKLLS